MVKMAEGAQLITEEIENEESSEVSHNSVSDDDETQKHQTAPNLKEVSDEQKMEQLFTIEKMDIGSTGSNEPN